MSSTQPISIIKEALQSFTLAGVHNHKIRKMRNNGGAASRLGTSTSAEAPFLSLIGGGCSVWNYPTPIMMLWLCPSLSTYEDYGLGSDHRPIPL